MELRLGAPALAGDTPEVMISSVVHGRLPLAASIFPRLLTHADWTRSIPHSPAGPQRGHAQQCENLFVNATLWCVRACLKTKHTTRAICYYIQYRRNTGIHSRAAARLPARFPWPFHDEITVSAKTSCCVLSSD